VPDPLSLAEARSALASGALSPAELLDGCAARIDATESVVRAWITLDLEGAHDQVRRLDPAGRTEAPLWGIPVGIKDIVDVAGLPTTAASKVLAGNVPGSDAPAVRRLREAGAVVLGKTNTQEFAYGVVSPPTTNPWRADRIPGGSSGGSAAAVAAGHCPAAIGTDTAGSIRIPAALCGVCGLKPRRGIVPMDGTIPLAPSFDATGPIARTAEDAGLLWQGLTAGPPLPAGRPDVRIGVPPAAAFGELSPGVAGAFARAVATLRLDEVGSCPAFGEFDDVRGPILMWEALAVHRSRGWWPERAGRYTEETRASLEVAERTLTDAAVAEARRACRRVARALTEAVDACGILATPTVPCEAPTHDEAARREEGSARCPIVRRLTRIPGPANAAGLAAMSLPCGLTEEGLPAGLQLIARDEATLLAAGRAIERETRWTPLVPDP
jgi:aspartyl-tRNA(Asn)/glutamyl-tRNA(Gln) amidotransferase subunit A